MSPETVYRCRISVDDELAMAQERYEAIVAALIDGEKIDTDELTALCESLGYDVETFRDDADEAAKLRPRKLDRMYGTTPEHLRQRIGR